MRSMFTHLHRVTWFVHKINNDTVLHLFFLSNWNNTCERLWKTEINLVNFNGSNGFQIVTLYKCHPEVLYIKKMLALIQDGEKKQLTIWVIIQFRCIFFLQLTLYRHWRESWISISISLICFVLLEKITERYFEKTERR